MDFTGWEKLSLVDYDDNITTTLFTSGCPFRCPWCHNGDLVVNLGNAHPIPWVEIKEYLSRRKNVLDAVCVTGGEPTYMPDLLDKLSEIKELGYKVKLDTNGSNPEMLRIAVEQGLVDYVAMDIKNGPSRYAETIGLSSYDIEPIRESVDYLLHRGIPYEFRTTLVKEFHTPDSIEEMGKFVRGAKAHFLQFFIDNEHCIERGFHPIEKEKAQLYRAILLRYVACSELRGYD